MKKAIITGITGQDGSYLAELLLDKGYEVHGIIRRSSSYNTGRIEQIMDKIHLHYGDLTDSANLIRLVKEIEPDEIYNLGAQSHVKISWDCPEFTAESDALGTLRLLEAIRINGLEKKDKILPSFHIRTLWFGSRTNSIRKDAFLSALSLWCGKTLRLLDYGELS